MTVQPLPSRPNPSDMGSFPRQAMSQGQAVKRPSGRNKWLILGTVLVVAAAAATYFFLNRQQPATPAVPPSGSTSNILTVTSVTATPENVARNLMVTGSLAAWDELPIGTQVSGLAIVQVLVDEGDKVKAGQVLARFDDSVLKAELASREASLREAEAIATEAEANIRRAEELSRTGAISGRDLDARRSTAATAKARVGVAIAARDQAAVRLAQTEIRSPTDGTVAKRNARLGAVMSAGGTELFTIIRDDRVELVAEVPEVDLPSLAPGQEVVLNATDADGNPFVGTVRLVSPVVDVRSRIGQVKIALPASPQLRPGMFVSGIARVGTVSAPVVPEAAIVYRDAKSLLVVADKAADENGHHVVHVREIRTGSRANGKVAILSGVTAGESVVLTGAPYLREGEKVTISDGVVGGDVRPLPPQ